jgi:hypothetical protein
LVSLKKTCYQKGVVNRDFLDTKGEGPSALILLKMHFRMIYYFGLSMIKYYASVPMNLVICGL